MRSYGKITYSPKSHLNDSKDWAIVRCDPSFCDYYIYLYNREFPWKPKLIRPVWQAHISFIRNENIINPSQWGLMNNKTIDFDYEPGVQTNGEYYWLKVKCDALLELRQAYGLPREPKFGLHLTIGRKM